MPGVLMRKLQRRERRRGLTVLEAAVKCYVEDQADCKLLKQLEKLALVKKPCRA